MPNTGSPYNLRYPASTDSVAAHTDFLNLATDVTEGLDLKLNLSGGTLTGGLSGTTAAFSNTLSVAGQSTLAGGINLAGVADTSSSATHYFVEVGTDGLVRPKTLANVRSEVVTTDTVNTAAATTVGTVTSGTWSASFGAVSAANLTNLTAGNLSGTIPSDVLGNSSVYIGTSSVALNRGSGALTLAGLTLTTPVIGAATGTSWSLSSTISASGLAGSLLSGATPVATPVGGAATVGTSAIPSRQDHVHPIPKTMGVYATSSGNQTFLNETWTAVNATSEALDNGGNWSTNTYTAPVAGLYTITASIATDIAGGQGVEPLLNIYKNGVSACGTSLNCNFFSQFGQITWTAPLVYGDTLSVNLWQNSGGTKNITAAGISVVYHGPVS